jgi:MarR family transcriptional regulator, organic hydroperoxide resistance regulator
LPDCHEIVQSKIVESPDKNTTTDESPLLALQRATHATLRSLATELADLGLTASEMNALANLADGDAWTISELGVAVGTRPTTLTSVLDRLEKRGHITRGPRPGDRRAVLVTLTDSGAETADVVRDAIADLERRALAGLSPEALAGLRAGLDALTRAAS